MTDFSRATAIVIGAAGGMGRACARLLGTTMDLVLTDASQTLQDFAGELAAEGYTIRAAIVGDFRSDDVMAKLADEAARGFAALVHASALPPSAPWREIIEVNHVATARLLEAASPHVTVGTAAVLIASVAGHLAPLTPEAEALLADVGAPGLLDALEPVLVRELGPRAEPTIGIGLLAYGLSKKKVIDACQAQARAWGAKGGRIMSISPGMIFTPMGRYEAEKDPMAEAQVKDAPIGRWGTAAEIASTANFLISPAAAFITGTDLRVDGGAFGDLCAIGARPWIEVLRASGS